MQKDCFQKGRGKYSAFRPLFILFGIKNSTVIFNFVKISDFPLTNLLPHPFLLFGPVFSWSRPAFLPGQSWFTFNLANLGMQAGGVYCKKQKEVHN